MKNEKKLRKLVHGFCKKTILWLILYFVVSIILKLTII